MNETYIKDIIINGETSLGIEFGSTRIKAVLIDETFEVIAEGSHTWENSFKNGYWTYSIEEIIEGLQSCYSSLADDVKNKYGVVLKTVGSIGISAMMHGYVACDSKGNLLVPFRTWRNTTTSEAAKKLSDLFNFNIPERWSIAHLYQAMLNGEEHVSEIKYLTTLAGLIHWKLTGEKVIGIGDASGMFPIDSNTLDFDEAMLGKFNALSSQYSWELKSLLPKVLSAGENAGKLTEEGARLLDVSGNLSAGIPMCPPEGDAGTGMVATNSVEKRTGNISAGTSVFAMVVTEKPLSKAYPEIDMVTTPDGSPVAMVHCNNCTSVINKWADVFFGFAKEINPDIRIDDVYKILYKKAAEGENDCGGIMSFNYLSGESITGCKSGVPLLISTAESNFTIENIMLNHMYSSVATLKIGLDILASEQVKIDKIFGHGGFFKTGNIGQRVMSAVVNAPISVLKTANVGGAWGMAVLAAFSENNEVLLKDYLNNKVFSSTESSDLMATDEEISAFEDYLKRYKKMLQIEKLAVKLNEEE